MDVVEPAECGGVQRDAVREGTGVTGGDSEAPGATGTAMAAGVAAALAEWLPCVRDEGGTSGAIGGGVKSIFVGIGGKMGTARGSTVSAAAGAPLPFACESAVCSLCVI